MSYAFAKSNSYIDPFRKETLIALKDEIACSLYLKKDKERDKERKKRVVIAMRNNVLDRVMCEYVCVCVCRVER